MKVLPLLVVIIPAMALFCSKPQRAGWISFDAFSSMDHITTVFEQVNANLSKGFHEFNIDGKNYKVNNLSLSAWYNDAAQKENYVDDTVANVTFGQLTISYDFIYVYSDTVGTAHGRVVANPMWLLKSIYLNKGALAWELLMMADIGISEYRGIQRSDPPLPDAEKKIF